MKITTRNTPETRKPIFPQQELQKNPIFDFFPITFQDGDTSFISQNYSSQTEIKNESNGVLFDQMKVSERRTAPKKVK